MIKKTTSFFKPLNNKNIAAVLFCAALFFGVSANAQTTRYVKPVPAGTADGSSWDNASNDIQSVLNSSANGDAVWVAGGTYKPNRKANALTVITPNDRDNAFVLKDSVQLYGGFAGTELLLSERNLTIAENASILSGDFNGDDELVNVGDTLKILNNAENAYHVLIGVGVGGAVTDTLDRHTRVDGFTIRGGNANDTLFTSITVNALAIYRYTGGGLMNRIYSKPTLVNVTFKGNNAIYGGGVYNRSYSDIILENATITQNTASFGGGVVNWLNTSPEFNNVVISNNHADAGGGMYNYSNANPALNDVEISENHAWQGSGGGMFNNTSGPVIDGSVISGNISSIDGGGIFSTANSDITLTDVTITDNAAQNGGGIFSTGGSDATITASTISLNEATTGHGGGMYNYQSVAILDDVIVEANNAAQYGGGIANWNQAPAQLTNVDIISNTAANAAGLFNYDNSPALLTYVHISNNSTTGTGGGIYNYKNSPSVLNYVIISNNTAIAGGGGIYNREASNAIITSSIIFSNTAQYGGGIYNFNDASPILTNVTITGNVATTYGGGMSSDSASPQVRNSIIFGNTADTGENNNNFIFNGANPTFSYSLVEDSEDGWQGIGTDGGNNIDADPLFTDAEDGDFSLVTESPAVNTGSNTYYSEGQTPDLTALTTDIEGAPRFFEGTAVDMGAYELQILVGIEDFNQLQVTCYPNPVVNYLNIQAQDPISAVAVYNMLGQEVKNATWNNTNNTVDMAGVQTGNYFVKVTIGNASKSVMVVKK